MSPSARIRQTPSALRRRRRRLAGVAAAAFLALVALHVRHRVADRRAWPEPVPGVALAPEPAAGSAAQPGDGNAWRLLASLPVPMRERPDAHHAARRELARFHAEGGFAATNAYPALDAWCDAMAPALTLWRDAAALPAEGARCGLASLPEQYEALGRARECALLAPYLAARARRDGDWDACLAAWRDALANAPVVTRGTGTAGHVVAYDMTLGVTRDLLSALAAMPAAALRSTAEALDSLALRPAQPLAESIRRDGAAAREVLSSFFGGDPPPGLTPPSGLFRWIARRNGSSPAVSAAHFDAILSHVVAAAGRPYSADGLYAGLPAWCRGRRPPWTNDPAAASAVCHLRDNTLSAGVYPVLRDMELAAARYAVRLALGDDAGPPPPDPFSPIGAPFVLDAPPPAWRFHSVGPDQRDDGGLRDWALARRPGPGLDFLFSCPPGAAAP